MTSRLIFWKMLERAAKAAAYGALGVIAASQSGLASFDVLTADWRTIGGAAGGMFVLSVLGSFASLPVGPEGPSLVTTPEPPAK